MVSMNYVLHTTFPAELKDEWNQLLVDSPRHVPFLRYEYLDTWWQTRGGGEWPESELAIVSAHDKDRLVGIAPLFKAVYKEIPSLLLLGSIEISDYLDFIVRPADLDAFLGGLLPFLKTNLMGWQALDLQGWRFEVTLLQHSPFIKLPGDWETYLASIDKKQRHEIRRKMRRAEQSDLPVRWYILEDGSRLEEEVEAFLMLMAQDEKKARFLTPPMRQHMHLTARCAFDVGCLHLAFLEIDGIKAAGHLSFLYLNRLWLYNSGIDTRFNQYSPGWVLLGNLLKWSNEQKLTEFDFMRGDEEYKYRFGGVNQSVMRVLITP
jgi:hypothetical protein